MVPFTSADALPKLVRPLAALLDSAIGLGRLQQLYPRAAGSDDFIQDALRVLDIAVRIDDEDVACLPADGPLVIVANHPHGAADGLAVAAAVRRVRPDVKLLGNELLARIPEMQPHVVTIDVFARGRRNGAGLRSAIEWVRQGHALVVFPAGAVAHVRAGSGRVVDADWRAGAARIAAAADARVVPMFIEGRNSSAFLMAGRVHPLLRTALLPRELLRLRGSQIALRAGRAVSATRLDVVGDAAAQTAYLRARCYSLAPSAAASGALRLLRGGRRIAVRVRDPIPVDRLAAEIGGLPPDARLLESGPWAVFCAPADAVPLTLAEIGRLREVTFRGVGEGTGRECDLDRYDRHYEHLFVWHRERRAIAGAYRVARADRVLERHGAQGLYTRSLFRYRRRLLRELGPSLELGRSFVVPEFQRDYQPLLLLWRGIGRIVARDPQYRRLFGPVSISADYGVVTRQILARFLLANRYRSDLGALVRPKRPLRIDQSVPDALVRSTVAGRLEDVEQIVRDLESDQRGMPILLRQYLKLNAKLLGFSVDPSFGNVLDGLVVVDLLDVEESLLMRYLGKGGAAAFLAFHRPTVEHAGALEPQPAVG